MIIRSIAVFTPIAVMGVWWETMVMGAGGKECERSVQLRVTESGRG